jgi:hypothetical protein
MEHSDFGAYRDAVVAEETEQRGPGHPWPAERTERPQSNYFYLRGFITTTMHIGRLVDIEPIFLKGIAIISSSVVQGNKYLTMEANW